MDKENEELLQRFQCDYNRTAEESFAQTLSEDENVRLFFINENQAFTDGRNIIVDPAQDELFVDRDALDQTGDFLGWPKVVLIDPWNVLRIVTRAQTIHECLHLLYTDFPGRHVSDLKCDTRNKKIVMGMISNIIEDAYIEAAGCSCFDNMEFYLKFGRISRLFVHKPSEGTVNRTFGKMIEAAKRDSEARAAAEEKKTGKKVLPPDRTDVQRLTDYLNYMGTFLLYPMVIQSDPPDDIAEYINVSKQFFLDGSKAPSPKERYDYASQIFDLVARLIPNDTEEDISAGFTDLEKKLGGTGTHSTDGSTISDEVHKGRVQKVSVRLFTDLNGNEKANVSHIDELMKALQSFARDRAAAWSVIIHTGSHAVMTGGDYDCAVVHKNIRINENRPQINLNLRKAYQNIYNRYKINIRSYDSQFSRILKARIIQREEKQLFGSGISPKRLSDPKKRYWYRRVEGEGLPDLAVLLLIDGSGSMHGERRTAAVHSAVILHEVLKKQGITHAVAEHRAEFEEPEMDVNILVGFDAREEEKYNLLRIDADGDNRDGLALYWAERYMISNTRNEDRLIIVLSDGEPLHCFDDYCPPVSTKDTANAVKKITGRGTNIIGISLDQPGTYECYDSLSEIYPNLVACNDLNRLTGQLLGIIAKLL